MNMDGLGEQCHLPVPTDDKNSSVSPPVGIQVTELRDQLQEPQDSRRRLGKLIIPATPVRLPEPSGSCPPCTCESPFPQFSALMRQDYDRKPFRARNIVVFGESGVGKSSVINMIAGEDITRTSNNAVGCTFQYECHPVHLDGLSVNLWDTVGLDEGTEGTVPAREAESSLKAFLRQITRRNGIDLLLYCVRGTRVRQALLRNYNIFYAAICRKKVPVALVVTGLENYEDDMEGWWADYEKDLSKHGMRFDAHACVTTIRSDHPAIQNRLKQSREALRTLVQTKFDAVAWKADEDSLVTASLPDVLALLRTTDKKATPFIISCDATEQVRYLPRVMEPLTVCIGGRKYQCLSVDARQVQLGHPKLRGETIRQPDLLIFYTDADSESDRTWTTLEQFHGSFSGETCPMIIVFRGLDNHEAAVRRWRYWSSTHGGEIIANPTYYPDRDCPREVVERAEEALAALVGEKCLIKFEEKLTKFQKFCKHSKLFFFGRI